MQPTKGFRGTVKYLGVVCPVTDSTHEPDTVQVQIHGVQTRVPWDKVEVVEDYAVRDTEMRVRLEAKTNADKKRLLMMLSEGSIPLPVSSLSTSPSSRPTWSLDGPKSPDDELYPNLFGGNR